ncbi:MAG: tRNA (guanosine(37)-N1)-methyltransferase TrmD [Candidatus Levybacteria bacterium]|nr:tRNA (guanosine(37)-N1)-methyltransferase TrmD [Candidatus Levybacteria bacterium]
MKISILTLFPEMFAGPFEYSILKRAQKQELIEIELINIRDFGIGKHKLVDDTPYGGGAGMIMRVDVIDHTISNIKNKQSLSLRDEKSKRKRVILLDPKGKQFNQKKAKELAKFEHLVLIAGHYEGVDDRVRKYLVDESISIGDYVLTGGEIPAMVVVDAVVRLIPGVIKDESIKTESFSKPKVLEYPQYTKPRVYKKYSVPKVLLSGNHQAIELWRKNEALKETKRQRPETLKVTP